MKITKTLHFNGKRTMLQLNSEEFIEYYRIRFLGDKPDYAETN